MQNVHEVVKVKSELQWRPRSTEDINNLEHLWRKGAATKAVCQGCLCYREAHQAGKDPANLLEPRWWQRTSGTRQETWNICSAVVWFSAGALCLYCNPFFLLEFRMSFCDVLYWKYVMIWVVFVVVSTYFVFFSIFLIVQKKYWTVNFFNLSCKVHGSFWSWIGGTLHSEMTVRL